MSPSQRSVEPDFPIHITGRCNNREPFPVSIDLAWDIFSNWLHVLRFQFDIRIHVFVLMPNHYHLICRDPSLNLSRGMACFMRETSREMAFGSNRINRIWGRRFHHTNIKSPLQYFHASKYVYRNPVAAGLCSEVEDYPWSSLQIILGLSRGIIPLETDENLIHATEKTLRWLNHSYEKQDVESLGAAFRRPEFKLRPHPHFRKPSLLEDWRSVPFLAPEQLTVNKENPNHRLGLKI